MFRRKRLERAISFGVERVVEERLSVRVSNVEVVAAEELLERPETVGQGSIRSDAVIAFHETEAGPVEIVGRLTGGPDWKSVARYGPGVGVLGSVEQGLDALVISILSRKNFIQVCRIWHCIPLVNTALLDVGPDRPLQLSRRATEELVECVNVALHHPIVLDLHQ